MLTLPVNLCLSPSAALSLPSCTMRQKHCNFCFQFSPESLAKPTSLLPAHRKPVASWQGNGKDEDYGQQAATIPQHCDPLSVPASLCPALVPIIHHCNLKVFTCTKCPAMDTGAQTSPRAQGSSCFHVLEKIHIASARLRLTRCNSCHLAA